MFSNVFLKEVKEGGGVGVIEQYEDRGESNGAYFYFDVFLLVKGGSKVDVTKLSYLEVCGIVSCHFNPN